MNMILTNLVNQHLKTSTEKHRLFVIRDWTIDGENILVNFNGGSLFLDLGDYCNWYNEVFRDCSLFQSINPETVTEFKIQFEDLEKYLRWEFGIYSAVEN